MEHMDPNDWPYQHPSFDRREHQEVHTQAPPSTVPHPDSFEFHAEHDPAGFRLLKLVAFSLAYVADVVAVFMAATAVFSALGREFIPAYIIGAAALYWSAWYYWSEFKLWRGFSHKHDLIHQVARKPAQILIWTIGFSVMAFPLVAITPGGTVVGKLLPAALGAGAGVALLGFSRAAYYERYVANLKVPASPPALESWRRAERMDAMRRRTEVTQ